RGARGRVAIGGEVVLDTERGVRLPPERRRVGYVPQDAALLPHLTALRNVRFGARGDRARVDSAIETLELAPLLERYPLSLSRGACRPTTRRAALRAWFSTVAPRSRSRSRASGSSARPSCSRSGPRTCW